jgi:hypothetical protein
MTSNIGVRDLQRRAVGFGGPGGADREKPNIDREYKQLFSPEFRNRLDAKIAFVPLDPTVMASIVGKFVRELAEQLAVAGRDDRADRSRDATPRSGRATTPTTAPDRSRASFRTRSSDPSGTSCSSAPSRTAATSRSTRQKES